MSLILNGTTGISDVDGTAAAPALTGTDTNTGIFFPAADTIAFAEGGAEAMRIDSSGNVGIGTSSPSYKLHAFSSSSTATVAKFAATNYGNIGTTYIEIGTQFGDGGSRIGNINTTGNTGTLVFETMTGTSGVYAERARIDSSGTLLVGATTFASGQNCVLMRGTNSGATDEVLQVRTSGTGSKFNTAFYNDNGRVGSIQTSGSTTSYVTSSDYRLKEAIAPMTGALAKVALLKPVTYKWKVDGSDGQGFIAHELQAVVPDCVAGEKDAVDADGNPQYQGIDTSFLVATLTAAIQEQQTLITALTARITALEGAAA